MRSIAGVFAACLLALLVAPRAGYGQRKSTIAPEILSAKRVYFDDRSGSDAVGAAAVNQLRKWGRFQVVKDKEAADLILLLSADPYNGGYIIFASGRTGTIGENGQVEEDRVPNYNRQAPVRDAYLTVIDPKTGQSLWSASHVWGGLLTGANSAGEKLVKKLQKQVGK